MADVDDSVASEPYLEGQHDHTVDDKGRVSLPAEFRNALNLSEGDEVIITRHLKERCLLVYWPAAWADLRNRMADAPPRTSTALKRVVGGSARRVKVDRLGRVQIPQVLRRYGSLEGKCFVMGQGRSIEVWATAVWDATHGPEHYADMDLSDFEL